MSPVAHFHHSDINNSLKLEETFVLILNLEKKNPQLH